MTTRLKLFVTTCFVCLSAITHGCGKSSNGSASTTASQNTNTPALTTSNSSASKTGTTYASSNAASSCLPPSNTATGQLSATVTDGALLTASDLSNFSPIGVLGAGFHNYYQVVTLTSPSTTFSRVVALHLWLDRDGQDTVGQTYTRAATVSVSLPGSSRTSCSTTWYPATVAYKLSEPLAGDDSPKSKAVGSFTVTVDKIGVGAGNFNASTTTTLPVGVDIDSCTQTTIGTLPDFHSNGAGAIVVAGGGNTTSPNTVSPSAAAIEFDASPLRYFFYRLSTESTCASGMHCANGYTVYGALSDDPNLCDKVQTNATKAVLPSTSRYIEIALDNSEQGLSTLASGTSSVTHAAGASAAPTRLNLPQSGSFVYTGSYKINITDPNTAQFLAYDFTFDPTGQPFERASNTNFISQSCARFN